MLRSPLKIRQKELSGFGKRYQWSGAHKRGFGKSHDLALRKQGPRKMEIRLLFVEAFVTLDVRPKQENRSAETVGF